MFPDRDGYRIFEIANPTCFVSFKNMSPLCIFSWPCPTSSFSSPFHHRYPVENPTPKWLKQIPSQMDQKLPNLWPRKKTPFNEPIKNIHPKLPIIKWNTNNYPSFPQLFCWKKTSANSPTKWTERPTSFLTSSLSSPEFCMWRKSHHHRPEPMSPKNGSCYKRKWIIFQPGDIISIGEE